MKKVLDKIQESQHFDKIYDHIILILKNLNSLIKYQSEKYENFQIDFFQPKLNFVSKFTCVGPI